MEYSVIEIIKKTTYPYAAVVKVPLTHTDPNGLFHQCCKHWRCSKPGTLEMRCGESPFTFSRKHFQCFLFYPVVAFPTLRLSILAFSVSAFTSGANVSESLITFAASFSPCHGMCLSLALPTVAE